uniref:Putative secreted protein n=1 Tax=Anopheles darlingi TaxID=43151 RepID=A0A2M4DCP2_ANODA
MTLHMAGTERGFYSFRHLLFFCWLVSIETKQILPISPRMWPHKMREEGGTVSVNIGCATERRNRRWWHIPKPKSKIDTLLRVLLCAPRVRWGPAFRVVSFIYVDLAGPPLSWKKRVRVWWRQTFLACTPE